MKTLLPLPGLVLLAGFALFATGCVAQFDSSEPVTSYSSTTLPAASSVALVMEFRGGEPTPQERADVRALLADYFSQQGSVLVYDTYSADYLVHAVLERRNPENPAEWTVVSTDSARALRGSPGEEFYWPGGVIEDDSYGTTTYSYVGFGVFYPVFFDLWSDPWHRGRVILHPPMRAHGFYDNDNWRHARRRHEASRWQQDWHPEWRQHGRGSAWDKGDRSERRDNDHRNRPGSDRRDNSDRNHRDNDLRSGNDRRPSAESAHATSPDTLRRTPPSGATGRRPEHPPITEPRQRLRDDSDHRKPAGSNVQRPGDGGDHRPPAASTVQRPPDGGEHRPGRVRQPQAEQVRSAHPEGSHTISPRSSEPRIAPPDHRPLAPAAPQPEVRNERPRRDVTVRPGHQVIDNPPQSRQPQVKVPAAPQVHPQPADRRAGTPERRDSGHDRRSPPKDQDKGKDQDKDKDKDKDDSYRSYRKR